MSVFGILLQIYIYSFVIATLAMFIEQGRFRLKTLVPILNTLLSLEFLNSILLKTFKANKDGNRD